MGKALDLFAVANKSSLLRPGGNPEALRMLTEAAAEWRDVGEHFYAAYAMSVAVHAAWGNGALVNEAIRASLADYACCIDIRGRDSREALAALWHTHPALRYCEPTPEVVRFHQSLDRELADRLLVVFGGEPEAVGYAVRGVCLSTDFDGHWDVSVPAVETVPGTTTFDGAGHYVFQLPSAFYLLLNLGDYRGAQAIVDRFPNEFTTPGLRGWKLAISGFLDSSGAADRFAQAAESFASDAPPSEEDTIARGVGWSGKNVLLWSKYFRARAVLARLLEEPSHAAEMVMEAAKHVEGTESGLVSSQVTRFRLLLQALTALVGKSDPNAITAAAQELRAEQRFSGERDADDATSRFFAAAEAALAEFQTAPKMAVMAGRLPAALEAVGRLPLIGGDVAKALQPSVGAHAVSLIHGLERGWIYRTLGSIKRETVLQSIFLRLAQRGLPYYAQIRHGPLEYGKDVVVLADEGGRNVLRQHQMKCGDLTAKRWRDVKPQLEEIFEVMLDSINIHHPVQDRIAILVCNGHAKPNVEPAMGGWFAAQKRSFGRTFEFMHIDDLVNWILRCGLVSDFRAACTEFRVKIL